MPDLVPPVVACPPPRRRPLSPRRAVAVLLSLLFASAVCFGTCCARRYYLGRWTHLFIVWNLLLAWIPVGFAFAAYGVHRSRTGRNLLFAGCALTWFIFFPNAPYIITDFVHLVDSNERVEVLWTDLFTYASFSWTGICLGYVSLCLMQEIVSARGGRFCGWLFVVVMLALCSLGVYIGRFLRWNSWDVLRHPIGIFSYGHNYHEEFIKPGMKIFLLLMFLSLALSYGTLYALAQLHEREPD